MSVLGTLNVGPADIAKMNAKEGIQKIFELMAEMHPIIDDMTMVECNQGTTHKVTIRTGYSDATWRQYYQGIQGGKNSYQQVVDTVGMLEKLPAIDADVIKHAQNGPGVRLAEHVGHLERMAQQVAAAFWYEDGITNPERPKGLSPRYNATTRATADDKKIDYNVIDGGGEDGDNLTSIWRVTWGVNAVSGLYPRGSVAGMLHEDKSPNGPILWDADDGSGKFDAYVDKYKWDIGFTNKDWRATGRIANIDIDDLETETGALDLLKSMIRMEERLVGANMGTSIWYMHKRVATALRIQKLGADASNTAFAIRLTPDTATGKMEMSFGEAPIHRSDALLLNEEFVPQAT